MATNKIVSAYYSYNPSPTELQPEEINGAILTNLLVGWTYVSQQTGACLPTSPLFLDGFRKCTQLRAKFPQLKVSLVCGDGANFSKMANSPALRGVFVQSAIALLESCGFDGLDLDWEFPVFNGKKYDRQNFVTLLRELRSAFQAHCPQYLLTIAVAAQKPIAVRAYDIPAIAPLIDFANIMCYDYNLFKPYNIWAGHNAPLFQRLNQRGIFATLNTVWSGEYWLTQGIPREKVVIGIPTYARGWKLLFSFWHSYNAPCVSAYQNGATTYPEVCDLLANGGCRVLDQQADVPFAYKGRQWVSYEDEQSITLKSQWIRKNDFGGAMIFSLNQDDWKGICPTTSEPFPLVGIVYRIITNGSKEEATEGPPSPLKDNLPLLK